MHIERLRSAKTTMPINAPAKPQHLKQNLKKELLELRRCHLIIWNREDEWDPVLEQNIAKEDALNRHVEPVKAGKGLRESGAQPFRLKSLQLPEQSHKNTKFSQDCRQQQANTRSSLISQTDLHLYSVGSRLLKDEFPQESNLRQQRPFFKKPVLLAFSLHKGNLHLTTTKNCKESSKAPQWH